MNTIVQSLGMGVVSCSLVTIAVFTTSAAIADTIPASITGDDGSTFVIEPDGGPAAVNPNGFTLDVDWTPEHIELAPPSDDRGEWLLRLIFEFTGTHDTTENFGQVVLTDHMGGPITALNVQFDDSDTSGTALTANYEIFGPDDDDTIFFVHDLHLAQSDGSGVDTLNLTSIEFSPRIGTVGRGIWVMIPEPSAITLATLCLLSLGMSRRRRRR
jgi:hypothetical protein